MKSIDLSRCKNKLVICYPPFGFIVGLTAIILFIGVMLGFTLFSSELPHWIFYVVFSFFVLVGLYLCLKIKNFKLIVDDNGQITVHSSLNTVYTFCFEDIHTVIRQTKKTGAERMIIKTANKNVIVENAAIGYDKFKKQIELCVEPQNLHGFERES